MEVDWDKGKAELADIMARRQKSLDKMYLQTLYEQNLARQEARGAASPSFGKFLGGAVPGAIMGAKFGPWGALAGGALGGLSGSGILGDQMRAQTPAMLQLGSMALDRYNTLPMSAAGGPLQTYRPEAVPFAQADPYFQKYTPPPMGSRLGAPELPWAGTPYR